MGYRQGRRLPGAMRLDSLSDSSPAVTHYLMILSMPRNPSPRNATRSSFV